MISTATSFLLLLCLSHVVQGYVPTGNEPKPVSKAPSVPESNAQRLRRPITRTDNDNPRRPLQVTTSRPRKLEPPFPNGLCEGTVVILPPEDTFGLDVNLANINLGGSLVLPPRPIQLWLPPNYDDNTSKRHPTLYVHDGQNAMQDSDSWTGTSWRLAGALTRMQEHGLLRNDELPILVLVPSIDGDLLPGVRRRHLEYGDSNIPFSQAHADLIAKTVKPLVDSRYRTRPEAEHTYAMGSSLGGQAALHLMLRHPDRFGGAACLSPAFGPSLIRQVAQSPHLLRDKRIYLDIGGDINDVAVPWVDLLDHLTTEHWWNPGYWWLDTQLQSSLASMKEALDRVGATYQYKEFPGGRHNERAWAQRVHVPLLHLFGKDS